MEHTDQDLGNPKVAIATGEVDMCMDPRTQPTPTLWPRASPNSRPPDKDRALNTSRHQDPAQSLKTSRPVGSFVSTLAAPAESSRAAEKRPTQGVAEKSKSSNFELIAADYGLTSPPSNAIDSVPTFEQERRPSIGYTSHYSGTSLPGPGAGASSGTSNMQLSVPEFRVRSKDFFVEGKVFIKLHTEEAGATGDHSTFGFSTVAYKEWAYSQLRRFVVVKAKPREFYCLCVPITTYSGRGAAKNNIDKSAHAIIYTGSLPPGTNPEEHGMSKTAIKVLPVGSDVTLHPMSRVNLGKTYSIEMNNKVKEIGRVDPKSLNKLITSWKTLMNT
ncbi:MAG: hypothetical protein Q9220_006654 [cf. Caloplaca sp. 1 TL-2023]